MEKKVFSFSSKSDFNQQIQQIDISVPLRSQGRKSEHTERYSIVSFLQNFVNDDLFDFPFEVTHRDKPDFSIKSFHESIGIEFIESIPEQLAHASALREEHFPNGVLEPEFFGWDAPNRNKTKILEILTESQKRPISKGSRGKSIEEKWIEGITGCLINKTKKLNNSNFEKFDKNWLLIYDNQTRSFLDKEYVSKKIKLIFTDYWNKKSELRFDKIFIESGKYFYQLELDLFRIRENLLIKSE